MKEWLRYFRIWFLVCGIILAAIIVCMVVDNRDTETVVVERVNKVCTETERVFDYADVLTDEEEDDLRELIAKREQQTQCDIILVVMNESLEEYAKGYFPDSRGNEWAMIKADNFYDEHGFGWNKYKEKDDGDGILLLDNWYRESDGKVYSWLSTSGKVYETFSEEDIDSIFDDIYYYDIEREPYKAYKSYVEAFYREMQFETKGYYVEASDEIPYIVVLAVPLVVAVIFVLVNLSGKEGKKTTQLNTYVAGGGRPVFKVNENRFIRKSVTRRHIERSSSGGSGGGRGGGHTSSGGHSHGGGGRSR